MQLIQVPIIVGASYMATISLLPHPLDEPQTAGVNPLSFVGSDKDPTRAVLCLAETNGGFQ